MVSRIFQVAIAIALAGRMPRSRRWAGYRRLWPAQSLRMRVTAAFCRELTRSRDTTALLGFSTTTLPGLEGLDAGVWDRPSLQRIRAE